MPRKGKEPAGLRRYRLAQKRKKAGQRKVRPMARRRRYARRRSYGRRRASRRRAQPSLLIAGALGAMVWDAYKNGYEPAGDQKLNAFVHRLTGVPIGRFTEFNKENAIRSGMTLGVGYVGSKALNGFSESRPIIRKVPIIGRRFKW